jgi:hypothetical protein
MTIAGDGVTRISVVGITMAVCGSGSRGPSYAGEVTGVPSGVSGEDCPAIIEASPGTRIVPLERRAQASTTQAPTRNSKESRRIILTTIYPLSTRKKITSMMMIMTAIIRVSQGIPPCVRPVLSRCKSVPYPPGIAVAVPPGP